VRSGGVESVCVGREREKRNRGQVRAETERELPRYAGARPVKYSDSYEQLALRRNRE
jgi:hypothetical protein